MLAKAPKGTKDIMPDHIYKWQYVERKFKEQAERYGFKEIRTPMFEHTELFKRGVGDTSDVVQKEMFTFEDRGRRDLALKPEGTASVARAFLEHNQYAEVQPAKYFYITPCYRDEQPQAGRQKEFHQFGVEGFGAKGMLADLDSLERNLKDQLKYADRKGYRCAVIIGDNELAAGRCQVKNLLESTQESVAFDELSDAIRKAIR